MPTRVLSMTGTSLCTIGSITDGSVNYVTGEGSLFSLIASGTTGQTVSIEASIDSVNWVVISTLTIGASNASDWDVVRHSFPYLRVTGTANVAISRGV